MKTTTSKRSAAATETTLQQVNTPQKHLCEYLRLMDDEMIHEIRGLCRQLHGVRVLHINSTAVGGGVAELLYSIVPLEVECGLEAEWRLLAADPKPFDVTKAFHNGLQGQKVGLSDADLQLYLRENEHSAQLLNPADYDVIVVHDPQPAALPHFVSLNQDRWVWRCHIDSSAPDPDVWRFLRPFVEVYDSAIFTRREFAPWDLAGPTLNVIAPEGRHGYPADLDNTHDRPRASHP